MLNTPSVVLAVFVVIVAVNILLFYSFYSPRMTSPPAPSSPPLQTEQRTTPQPATTAEQTPQPTTTLEGTTTATATPTAATTPSP